MLVLVDHDSCIMPASLVWVHITSATRELCKDGYFTYLEYLESGQQCHTKNGWLSLSCEAVERRCMVCQEELKLINIKHETKQGLGSIWYVECLACGSQTAVYSGSQHQDPHQPKQKKRIFDINTKAAGSKIAIYAMIQYIYYLFLIQQR